MAGGLVLLSGYRGRVLMEWNGMEWNGSSPGEMERIGSTSDKSILERMEWNESIPDGPILGKMERIGSILIARILKRQNGIGRILMERN